MIRERWSVGDLTITRACELEAVIAGGEGSLLPDAVAEAVAEMPWLRPHFVTDAGGLAMSIHALLVEAPGLRLIVDTCVGNDKTRSIPNLSMLHTGFLESLAGIGWTRESIGGVLCTHLHVDHAGWNTMLEDGHWVPTFPNACYYFGREEYEFWCANAQSRIGYPDDPATAGELPDEVALFEDSIRPVMEAGLVTLVETDAELAPGIRLVPTPGHTPGHVSVLLESRGARAVITGDTFHHPCQIGRPEWASVFDHSPVAATATRRSLLERFADSDALVIGTHFVSPTAGWIVSGNGEYSFRV